MIKFKSLLFVVNWLYFANSTLLGNSPFWRNQFPSNVFDSYLNLTELEPFPNICDEYNSEKCAIMWLSVANDISIRNENRLTNAYYEYSTNITQSNLKIASGFHKEVTKILKRFHAKARKFKWKAFQNPMIRLIFDKITTSIESSNESISQRLIDIKDEIDFIYNNGRPCFKTCLQSGEKGLIEFFQKETNYDELAGFWVAWRNVTGLKIKHLFTEMVNLENVGARENGYSDAASYKMLVDFDEETFPDTMMSLFNSIFPFYRELHAYVRYCLSRFYPGKFDSSGPIPAHIFGNVWAEQWTNIFPIIKRCARISESNDFNREVNDRLSKLSVKNMFQMAESFFSSLGMYNMTDEFWQRSMFEKPHDRIVDCHPSSTDFANGRDFRMIMCTKKNLNDLTFVHHEMGHIQYFMAYRHLPFFLRGSANVGLQETIGDTIVLALRTPEHLQKVNVLSEIPQSFNFDLEYLMSLALEKVSFLPHALVMDSYIRYVFSGIIPLTKLNERWWQLKHKFQGIIPPVERSENDFDAGSKYHIAFGIPYMRYLYSFMFQYQLYESMCHISGYRGVLHRCDFFGSKKAGNKMLQMLKQGQSRPWRETIKMLTGTDQLKSTSLLKFYDPLFNWLKQTNKRLNIPVGW